MDIFHRLFKDDENTVLIKGDDEPWYKPAQQAGEHHQIIFAHGFFSSALHEIAHWCIAGKQRRQLIDYGYWYEPDGRSVDQQLQFAKVEAKPQALEWIFNHAAARSFVISLDNFSADASSCLPFKQAILDHVKDFQKQGLPARAELFVEQLTRHYHRNGEFISWRQHDFCIEALA